MQFFRDRKLAKRFRNCDVSEKEQMLYVLFTFIFMAICSSAFVSHATWADASPNMYDHIIDILNILAISLITIICYKTNQKGDNCAFVTRYISIGFPVMIQITILGFFLGFLAAMADDVIKAASTTELLAAGNIEEEISDPDLATGPSLVISMIILYIYLLWRMNSSMKIAASVRE